MDKHRSLALGLTILSLGLTCLFQRSASAYQFPIQVTQSPYSAKCDGSSDDTMAISMAVGAAAATGATVQFPAGVCVISGSGSYTPITLVDVTLLGAEAAHYSDSNNPTEAGTFISIGTGTVAPGPNIPFFLEHGVTIRGINFVYPYEIAHGTVPPPALPPLFSDNGTDEVSNILFDNVHVIAAYNFWVQQGTAPTYGNIRFVNTDVYALYKVFDWSNVQESVTFDNFISNPSLCGAYPYQQCSQPLEAWTGDNGIWLHVGGSTDSNGNHNHVGGLQASNLTISSYKTGVLIDSNGHLDESLFGSTTVFDGVPYVLYVNSNGSITHTVFSGKITFNGKSLGGTVYANAAFTLNNPQFPLAGNQTPPQPNPVSDHNTLSLNGLTADGIGGPLLSATVTTGDIGAISIVGVVARHYCDNLDQGGGTNTDVIDISAASAAVLIVGSQITTAHSGCGALSVTAFPYVNANNIVGNHPNN